MPSRIIVEGPDGSGKTTLINNLLYTFHFLQLVQERGPSPDVQERYLRLLEVAPPAPYVPLHDRYFYSELVYGPVIRRKIRLEYKTISYIEDKLHNEALLIYCRPPLEVINDAAHRSEQMSGVCKNLEAIIRLYDDVMKIEEGHYDPGRFIRHDWTKEGSYTRIIQAVERFVGIPIGEV